MAARPILSSDELLRRPTHHAPVASTPSDRGSSASSSCTPTPTTRRSPPGRTHRDPRRRRRRTSRSSPAPAASSARSSPTTSPPSAATRRPRRPPRERDRRGHAPTSASTDHRFLGRPGARARPASPSGLPRLAAWSGGATACAVADGRPAPGRVLRRRVRRDRLRPGGRRRRRAARPPSSATTTTAATATPITSASTAPPCATAATRRACRSSRSRAASSRPTGSEAEALAADASADVSSTAPPCSTARSRALAAYRSQVDVVDPPAAAGPRVPPRRRRAGDRRRDVPLVPEPDAERRSRRVPTMARDDRWPGRHLRRSLSSPAASSAPSARSPTRTTAASASPSGRSCWRSPWPRRCSCSGSARLFDSSADRSPRWRSARRRRPPVAAAVGRSVLVPGNAARLRLALRPGPDRPLRLGLAAFRARGAARPRRR